MVDYVARARALAPLLTESGAEIEQRRELPEKVVAALIEGGFFRLLQPKSLGGAELPPARFAEVMEEVAKADASTAWCLGQGNGCAMSAAYLEPAAAKEIFGPADGILAWGPPGKAEARAVEGGYRVSGSWAFASGSRHATWLGAHVPISEADGSPRRRPDGQPAIRSVLFPKKSAKITDIWQVMGLKGTGSDAYSIKELFVPEAHTVLRDSADERRERGQLYNFSSSMLYASGFAGVALGIARATLDAFITTMREKVPRGAKKTLRENNVVQAKVALAEVKLRSCRSFLITSLDRYWDHVGRGEKLTQDQRVELRLASTFAINQARDVVDIVYSCAGATAIFESNPFERRFRDIHTVTQQQQGREIHFESCGQILLGLDPDQSLFTF